jgi:hypothetical protein
LPGAFANFLGRLDLDRCTFWQGAVSLPHGLFCIPQLLMLVRRRIGILRLHLRTLLIRRIAHPCSIKIRRAVTLILLLGILECRIRMPNARLTHGFRFIDIRVTIRNRCPVTTP